jgi:hypothetical protein
MGKTARSHRGRAAHEGVRRAACEGVRLRVPTDRRPCASTVTRVRVSPLPPFSPPPRHRHSFIQPSESGDGSGMQCKPGTWRRKRVHVMLRQWQLHLVQVGHSSTTGTVHRDCVTFWRGQPGRAARSHGPTRIAANSGTRMPRWHHCSPFSHSARVLPGPHGPIPGPLAPRPIRPPAPESTHTLLSVARQAHLGWLTAARRRGRRRSGWLTKPQAPSQQRQSTSWSMPTDSESSSAAINTLECQPVLIIVMIM